MQNIDVPPVTCEYCGAVVTKDFTIQHLETCNRPRQDLLVKVDPEEGA